MVVVFFHSSSGEDSETFKSAVDQVTSIYDQMIADLVRSSGRPDPREILLREHKASILAYYGSPSDAVTASREAFESASALGSEESSLLIRPLIDIGQSARRAGDFRQSYAAFKRAVDLSKKNCPDFPRTQLVPLGQLARVQAESGDSEKALASAQSVIELARETYGANHGRYFWYIELTARTLRENDHHEEAQVIEGLKPSKAPSAGFVYTAGLDKPARRTKTSKPAYPRGAQDLGFENRVVFRATVGPDGKVQDAHPEVCVGFGFEEETIKAVRRYRYEPAVVNGKPVASAVGGVVDFRLDADRR